jgi:hypothetical protein
VTANAQRLVVVHLGRDAAFSTLEAIQAVLRIRIHLIHMFLGLWDPDPDPLVRGMDPDPSIIMQK